MSTFAFFTRFFVLLIISHLVVFSAGGQYDADGIFSTVDPDGGVVRKSLPSLELPEQSAINCFVLTVEGTAMVRDAGALRRIDSGMVLAVLQSMDKSSVDAVFGFFYRVIEMKDEYDARIKELRRAIEDRCHQALRNEFNWRSQLVVPDPPKSPE